MPSQAEKISTFRALHVPGQPLLMPNPWDAGSAKLLESLGFSALATTSGGHAGTLGCVDGSVSRDGALAHAAALVAAVDAPVSADLENGFAERLQDVHDTVRAAVETGLAGCSIEDFPATPPPRSTSSVRRPSECPQPPRPRTRPNPEWC